MYLDLVNAISPTLKLGATLVSIVVLMRFKVPMGASLLAGSALMWALFPMGAVVGLAAIGRALRSEESIFLLFIVVGLLMFSSALNRTGQIQRIIRAFRSLMGASRMSLIAFPALIGLLPMPGGAIFSAPMVKAAVEGADITPERTTAANYWFRHIWEYWFPLYPGVILMLALTGAPTMKFIALALPMTLFSVGAGYFVLLRGVHLREGGKRQISWTNLSGFILELTPILIVVSIVVGLSPVADRLAERVAPGSVLLQRSAILLAIVLAMGWLVWRRGLNGPIMGQIVRDRHIIHMVFLVLGVVIFKAVLEASGAVGDLQAEFESHNVPLVAVLALLPFIAGVVIGIAVGFVGSSFPLVIALVGGLPETERLTYYFLAYAMGYAGMMLSPVHICLVATAEYFRAEIPRVYRFLIPLGIASTMAGVLLFVMYRYLLVR